MNSSEGIGERQVAQPLTGTWAAALASARSEREVVSVVKDFLSQWSPAEIASLPEDCRPGRIGGADDVAEMALKFSQAQCSLGEDFEQRLVLERMEAFFAHASSRLAQVLSDHTSVS